MATSRHYIRSFLLRSIATSKTHSYFSALINSEKTSISHLRHFTNIYSTVARNDSVQKVSKFREPKIHLSSSFSTSSFSSQLAEEDSYVLDWETTTTTKTKQQQNFATLASQTEPEMMSSSTLDPYLEEEPEETTSSDMTPFVEPTDIYIPVKAFFISRRFVKFVLTLFYLKVIQLLSLFALMHKRNYFEVHMISN